MDSRVPEWLRPYLRKESLPQWVISGFSPAYKLVEWGGDLDFLASLWQRGASDVFAFAGEWGWLVLTPLGLYWLYRVGKKPIELEQAPSETKPQEPTQLQDEPEPIHNRSQAPLLSPIFFRDRTEMNTATGGLLGEVRAARRVWYTGIAGEYARANGLYAMPQFQRALLLDPYGHTISSLVAAVPGETESHLRQTIEQATREAQAHNVEVRWFDGPILGMTILEPNERDGSIRAEVLTPFSLERPNFKVLREDPLYSRLLGAFEKIWSAAPLAVISATPVNESEPPDEQLVLLCNSYAIPAFDALRPVLKAIFDQCFTNGGWQGLSARYFRDYAFEPHYGEALRNVQDLIVKGSPAELEGAFIRYCSIYLFAGAFVWHSSRIGTLADLEAIGQWVKRHDSLIDQVRILSGGIDRKGLKTFLDLNNEYIPMPREVLEKASS